MKKFKLYFCLLAGSGFFTPFYVQAFSFSSLSNSETSIDLVLFADFKGKLEKSSEVINNLLNLDESGQFQALSLMSYSLVENDINPGFGWKIVNTSYTPIIDDSKIFKGRQLPWGKIKVTTKWMNQDEGEYKNTCALVSGALDKEFSRWRYLEFVSCKEEATKLQKVNKLKLTNQKKSKKTLALPTKKLNDHAAGAVPINGAAPEYPPNAEDNNREGKVVASCDILPSGKTANCKIVSHIGGPEFIASAMDFLARARYQPSVKNGVPMTEYGHTLTIDFTLRD